MNEDKQDSVAPISNYGVSTPTKASSYSPLNTAALKSGKGKPASRRKQLKAAKKNHRGALNLRRWFTGLFLLALVGTILYLVFNPSVVGMVLSGEVFNRTQTCTVTKVNPSNFFDTSCGVFYWDDQVVLGSPSANLGEGQTYMISSSGVRIPVFSMFPTVQSIQPAG